MIYVSIIGSLCWSSTWWWWPHITGSIFCGPLLRAGSIVLFHIFFGNWCKVEKNYHAESVLGLKIARYFQGWSFFHNWGGAAPTQTWMSSSLNFFPMIKWDQVSQSILFWFLAENGPPETRGSVKGPKITIKIGCHRTKFSHRYDLGAIDSAFSHRKKWPINFQRRAFPVEIACSNLPVLLTIIKLIKYNIWSKNIKRVGSSLLITFEDL